MEILLPHATSLALIAGQWAALTPDGELLEGSAKTQKDLPPNAPFLVCHAPYIGTHLNLPAPPLDILELFAFVRPASFCVPTIGGLATALNMPTPTAPDDQAMALPDIVTELLRELANTPPDKRENLANMAALMGQSATGWGWTTPILAALGITPDAKKLRARETLGTWATLPEWSEEAPPPPPSSLPISADDARTHLADLITRRRGAGRAAQSRAAQENYTTRLIGAFDPRDTQDEAHTITAEAGTGVGKTLGYLAPAQAWAEKNHGTVWVSTYTRNLQRQLDTELETLYPNPEERARGAIIRKGRENYLCLLNFEDLVGTSLTARDPRTIVAAGLMARFVSATRDGDLTGATFPGWLTGLLGLDNTLGLADRRGECIYSACGHYHRCFIERSTRLATRARLVVGNHALAMRMLALANDGDTLPTRYVFDEGHHIFDAADSAFALDLTGLETADFRRWVLGPEDEGATTRRARRSKGLKKRMDGLLPEDDNAARRLLDDASMAARALPGPGWRKAVSASAPRGPIEAFLSALRAQVLARAQHADSPWSIECDITPPTHDVQTTAKAAIKALRTLYTPLRGLAQHLRKTLQTSYDDLNQDTRARYDALSNTLERRATNMLGAWIDMLATLATQTEHDFIDWFEITRIDGREFDIGFFRRYQNPSEAFANALKPHAHGVLITSATLKSSHDDDERAWHESDTLTGAANMSTLAPERVSIPSPFDYKTNTRVLIVTDVPKNTTSALGPAYEALFKASNGGALGLFTAIHRLRAVHAHLNAAMANTHLPLYAQHVDQIDIGTLVDMFRAQPNACLLGTDAARDGVDVPGDSLRLIVFDRVPWPRPTILHRERKKTLGGKAYDEQLTRMKLQQAYGRLIRTPSDSGLFVLLDNGFPSRLASAFPPDVIPERVPLSEAIDITSNFFA